MNTKHEGVLPIAALALLQAADPLATIDAIRRLERHLVDCDGPVARGIVSRAIGYLEMDLLSQLSGPPGARRRVAPGAV